ncbi:ribosomal protein S18 acetylase RimI-like enzyme [Saccharopolyspora phatthalungensis]|uniref:Ribosomal protein S18 acetylase RimI-like enzyme n=1 Tax=Saccharopolyspora phatthalungensis TaxID=664693 RepID=A0A840QDC5_9PSEU|nr:ribosomal protein S18 acetylase RimI-like enzyme [Saccharopolyspora phatthalungensis]
MRLATRSDLPDSVRTLARAFRDYPYTRHTLSADDHERRVGEAQQLLVDRIGLEHGQVWIVNDGDAVAVWTTPESTGVGAAFAELAPRMATLAGERAEAALQAEQTLGPHRPTEPVWFLATVGVDPELQGRGLGSAVLRPGLDQADQAGVPAYLETSDKRNLAIYRRLGFEVTAEVALPEGGPLTWSMVRQPQRGARS